MKVFTPSLSIILSATVSFDALCAEPLDTIIKANQSNRDSAQRIACKMRVEQWRYDDPSGRIEAFDDALKRDPVRQRTIGPEDKPHHISLIRANAWVHERVAYCTDGRGKHRADREDLRDVAEVLRQFQLPDSFANRVRDSRAQTLMGFIDQTYVNVELALDHKKLIVSRHENTAGSIHMCPVMLGTIEPQLLKNAAANSVEIMSDAENPDLIRLSWRYEALAFKVLMDRTKNYRIRQVESRTEDGFRVMIEEANHYKEGDSLAFPFEYSISVYDADTRDLQYQRRLRVEDARFGTNVLGSDELKLSVPQGTMVLDLFSKDPKMRSFRTDKRQSIDLNDATQLARGLPMSANKGR